MFFPLVVLAAILPGLAAMRSWDLTVPGPLWGLRAMAVAVDGMFVDQTGACDAIKPERESAGYRSVAFQPPLYPWLAAVGLTLSGDCDPLACVLPSYAAGAAIVMLVYLHGRLWRGGGMGFTAALLMAFSPSLLLREQEMTPHLLATAGALAALYAYAARTRIAAESADPRGRSLLWSAAGGVALGASLLTVEAFGLIVVAAIGLHQVYVRVSASADPSYRPSPTGGRHAWIRDGGAIDAALALGVATAIAAPWHLSMFLTHGWSLFAPLTLPASGWADSYNLAARILELAPVAAPLAVFGAARAVRTALIAESDDRETIGGSLWAAWAGVAALTLSLWTTGPRQALEIFLLIPLNLLAAATVADLVNRRVSVRALIGLAPAAALCLAWWSSKDLRSALDDLLAGRASAATTLSLHMTFDLIVVSIILGRGVERWARNRDDRQRQVLATFLLATLVATVGLGVREMVFRHSETSDLLMLRTMILRRNRERPFNHIAVVSPPSSRFESDGEPGSLTAPYPGGRLRFILRTALPALPQIDLTDVDELLTLPDEQRLVVLYGAGSRLSYSLQSRLGLEAIHPGRTGILDAYATASSRVARR
ncbi:glycosyltransferase family 39 protein [Paludisphaera mucosa]|uniref:Glycosyltransferase family 39 protein n=1 Tax=Paludisphaera mucosa TaxID=3030827 RepID=A0ABT6FJ61_9BACT|nr:glycosyltransferase family 39 protein [Paludisphaera mucosa]MDG3007435.1 glycosyltransferase family 39 protein [Paludisphaera mucosa]